MKMDVIPGRENHYRITPTTIGDYRGKCYELCGVYHSRMLFNVKVVSAEDFDTYLQGLEDAGHTSDQPLTRRQQRRTRRQGCPTGGHAMTTTAGRPTVDGDDRPAGRSASRSSGSSPPPTTR